MNKSKQKKVFSRALTFQVWPFISFNDFPPEEIFFSSFALVLPRNITLSFRNVFLVFLVIKRTYQREPVVFKHLDPRFIPFGVEKKEKEKSHD